MKKKVKVETKNGDVIEVFPFEVENLKKQGIIKEKKTKPETKEEKNKPETKSK